MVIKICGNVGSWAHFPYLFVCLTDTGDILNHECQVPKEGKINAEGRYIPFWGYTVISMVDKPTAAVEEYIKSTKTLSQYLTPLPSSSYHVTMYDIFSQRTPLKRYFPKSCNIPPVSQWPQVVRKLGSDLSAAQEQCLGVVQNITFFKHNFNLPKAGFRGFLVEGSITNQEEVSKLRNKCSSIFEKKDGERIFHLTLGYTFRDIDDDAMEKINEELRILWEILPAHYRLKRPNVYYFEKISEFIPVFSE